MVAVKVTGVRPARKAIASWVPAAPRVHTTLANPLTSVSAAAALSEPPPTVTRKLTDTPALGFPKASVTRTRIGSGSGTPAAAVWLLPLEITSVAGGAATAVAVNGMRGKL